MGRLALWRKKLKKELHPTKNGSIDLKDCARHSHLKLWWICPKGHKWQEAIKARNSSQGCPYCSHHRVTKATSLAIVNPSLAKEWHPTKNRTLTPDDVLPNSHKKAWWLCKKGHAWQATIGNRNFGCGCPYCTHQKLNFEMSLAAVNPILALQWHPTKNGTLTPADVFPKSNSKAWWLYPCGHELEACIFTRNKGVGCFICNTRPVTYEKSLEYRSRQLLEEWHPTKNGSLTPSEVSADSFKGVWWICKKNHTWTQTVQKRWMGEGCPFC